MHEYYTSLADLPFPPAESISGTEYTIFRAPSEPAHLRSLWSLEILPKLDWRNLTGTTQFQRQVKAEDETRFKLYEASIIFLLKEAYHDNIPSSYIYIPKNSTISYCLYLYWNCYSHAIKKRCIRTDGRFFHSVVNQGK